jgi:glutathione-regulated potassium-efflux system ancillary protein KefG
MKNRILILFAHPRFERSANNSFLLKSIPSIPEITFHDLYERYPDFNINVQFEKDLLSEHQIIIWQHPFYWYSSPPLIKQWIDLVLTFGWAYGPGGTALRDKIIFNSITSGGQRSAYGREGYNRFTVREFLAPFEQTAALCKMIYLPPFAIHGTHIISNADLTSMSGLYEKLLQRMLNGEFEIQEIVKFPYLNDWILSETTKTQLR